MAEGRRPGVGEAEAEAEVDDDRVVVVVVLVMRAGLPDVATKTLPAEPCFFLNAMADFGFPSLPLDAADWREDGRVVSGGDDELGLVVRERILFRRDGTLISLQRFPPSYWPTLPARDIVLEP